MKHIAVIILLLLVPLAVQATEKPSLDVLVKDSDMIVVGKVAEVTVTPREEKVLIEVSKEMKNKLNLFDTEMLEFRYWLREGDPGKPDFQGMKGAGSSHVFFLSSFPKDAQEIENMFLELADGWFGVEEAKQETVSEVGRLVKANH